MLFIFSSFNKHQKCLLFTTLIFLSIITERQKELIYHKDKSPREFWDKSTARGNSFVILREIKTTFFSALPFDDVSITANSCVAVGLNNY